MNRFLPHDLGLVERAGPDLCDYVVIAPGLEVVYDFCTRSTLDTDCTGSPQVRGAFAWKADGWISLNSRVDDRHLQRMCKINKRPCPFHNRRHFRFGQDSFMKSFCMSCNTKAVLARLIGVKGAAFMLVPFRICRHSINALLYPVP